QLVEQRRLPRVRVADERNRRERAPRPRFALRRTRGAEILQRAFEALDALEQAATVDLELGLARPSGTDAGTLLAQLRASTPQSRQAVAKLGELDLHAS